MWISQLKIRENQTIKLRNDNLKTWKWIEGNLKFLFWEGFSQRKKKSWTKIDQTSNSVTAAYQTSESFFAIIPWAEGAKINYYFKIFVEDSKLLGHRSDDWAPGVRFAVPCDFTLVKTINWLLYLKFFSVIARN